MKVYKKHTVSDDDLALAIDLLKERDKCYSEADRLASEIKELQREMKSLRRQARLLSCEEIGNKLELNKDIIFEISKCRFRPDDIIRIDPDFYKNNCDESS